MHALIWLSLSICGGCLVSAPLLAGAGEVATAIHSSIESGRWVGLPNSAEATRVDPTARVDAKIYVTRQRVRMVLSQFSDDLVWLHGMEADAQGLFSAATLQEFYQLHKQFLGDRIQVLDAQGNRLSAVLVDEGPYPFDDQLLRDGATEFHLVKRKMQFTFEFASPHEELGTFTIKHTLVDENFLYPAELSLELFQGESDLPLKGKLRLDAPMTVDLDWESPVPALQASDEEKRAWLERQDQRLLGVTNFGAVYLWAYVEPRHLRVEVLVPLNVLATLFELESQDPEFLQATEMVAAEERIRRYFSAGNPVRINDQTIAPIIQRVDFFPADQRDFALRRSVERISTANGRVGLSLLYPYREVPREIGLSWDKFSYALNSVQAYLFFGAEVQAQVFSRQLADNRLVWQNQGAVREPEEVVARAVTDSDLLAADPPAASPLLLIIAGVVVCLLGMIATWHRGTWVAMTGGGAAGLTTVGLIWLLTPWWSPATRPSVAPAAGDQIAQHVLKNVYRALEFVREEEIYAALAKSASGEKLRELYLQMLRDLQVEDQGGAVSRIESVEIVAVESLEDDPAGRNRQPTVSSPPTASGALFQRRIRWNLSGLIEHWGHSHQRTNQYQAIATIVDDAGQWKIVDLNIESQAMGTTQPRPNRFRPAGSTP
jgi:hypothetical protein